MTKLIGDPARELETVAAYVVQNVDGGYCHHNSIDCGHSTLVPLYMLRIADPQPQVNDGEAIGACTMPGPLCSDDEIRAFIRNNNALISTSGKRSVWHQETGIYTVGTSDDSYRLEMEKVPTRSTLPGVTSLWQAINKSTNATEGDPAPLMFRQNGGERSKLFLQCLALAAVIAVCLWILACCRALSKNPTTRTEFPARGDMSTCLDSSPRADGWEELRIRSDDRDIEAE